LQELTAIQYEEQTLQIFAPSENNALLGAAEVIAFGAAVPFPDKKP